MVFFSRPLEGYEDRQVESAGVMTTFWVKCCWTCVVCGVWWTTDDGVGWTVEWSVDCGCSAGGRRSDLPVGLRYWWTGQAWCWRRSKVYCSLGSVGTLCAMRYAMHKYVQ